MPAIWRYLFEVKPDPDCERTVLVDRDLPPYVRPAALSRLNYFSSGRAELLPIARSELAALRRTRAGARGVVGQIADTLESRLA